MNRTAFTLAVGLPVAPVLCVATLTTRQAAAQTLHSCGVPSALDDGWPIDTPDALGFDRSRLCGLADRPREADDVHARGHYLGSAGVVSRAPARVLQESFDIWSFFEAFLRQPMRGQPFAPQIRPRDIRWKRHRHTAVCRRRLNRVRRNPAEASRKGRDEIAVAG